MATKRKAGKKPAAGATSKKGPRSKAKAASKPKPKAGQKAASRRPAAAKALKDRRQPETLRLRSMAPIFTVNDLEKSRAFYRDVLGCSEGETWMKDGHLAGVEMVAGSGHFWLGQDDWQKGRDRVKGIGCRVFCTTAQDVDEIARRIRERGGALDSEPVQHDWGREIALTDPDGFKITILNEAKKK